VSLPNWSGNSKWCWKKPFFKFYQIVIHVILRVILSKLYRLQGQIPVILTKLDPPVKILRVKSDFLEIWRVKESFQWSKGHPATVPNWELVYFMLLYILHWRNLFLRKNIKPKNTKKEQRVIFICFRKFESTKSNKVGTTNIQ
jgi:hypothetical protein